MTKESSISAKSASKKSQRFDVYETDKKHIMELLRETFRDYKAKFKSLYYRPSETPASVIARGGPKNMPANQFADMVTYWYSSKGKVALDKAIEEQMSQCPPDTPLTDIHEAAFRSTFGEEYYGRCRGMGMGVTAIQVYPELSRRSQTTRKGQQKSNDSEEIAILKSQVATMQTTIDFLVDDISRQGSRNDRSGTSGAPGIHLYPDQFLKMMSLIRGQNSNNVTTSNDTPQTNHATRANCEEGSGQPDITVEQKAMNGVYCIVYVCPEIVLRLIEPLKRLAENNGIALFAIDEVHCVSKWGHDFRPDYRRLSVLRENFSAAHIRSLRSDIPLMALTATATLHVREDIRKSLLMSNETKLILTSFFRPNLRFSTGSDKKEIFAAALPALLDELLCFPAEVDVTESEIRTEKIPMMIQNVSIILSGSDDLPTFLKIHFVGLLNSIDRKMLHVVDLPLQKLSLRRIEKLIEMMGSYLSTHVPKIMVKGVGVLPMAMHAVHDI
ncbi:ATP-dependent DNA helicase Q-like SIM [Platanthera zijinensis]|uniref:ATP-dependent DNA helicase Q-like SIM n=1 Tax=Platanthera zijinensis TaxID=2320716 RepID=A0AAP0C284_9ASPA